MYTLFQNLKREYIENCYFNYSKTVKNLNVDITSYYRYVKEMNETPILSNLIFNSTYPPNHRGSSYFFSEWSSLFLLPTKLVHLSLTWKIADFLRNNNGKWLMVVNLEKSFSMKNCPMVKKILKILYNCLKKDFYYIFLFLKVSPCKLSKKKQF